MQILNTEMVPTATKIFATRGYSQKNFWEKFWRFWENFEKKILEHISWNCENTSGKLWKNIFD